MIFLRLIILVVVLLGVSFVVTQIVIPLVLGTALFPLFRINLKDTEEKLRSELEAVRQQKIEVALKEQLTKEQEAVASKSKTSSTK